MLNPSPRVLIVAEHASARFGGEAALPLHYFRILHRRGIDVWMIVHERTRAELTALFPDAGDRISYVPDTWWHRLAYQLGKNLPNRLEYITLGFASRLLSQWIQRRLIRRAIQAHQITVIHQPIPVSPKEPSMIFGMGVPVVMGPMNGGMAYPPAFGKMEGKFTGLVVGLGRQFSNVLNRVLPGKRQAAILLVANRRTQQSLPAGTTGRVIELVENGVDLEVWRAADPQTPFQTPSLEVDTSANAPSSPTLEPLTFVYVGRLVDWKAVDCLISAFAQIAEKFPVKLEIIGDGKLRGALESQAAGLGLLTGTVDTSAPAAHPSQVEFVGWLSQVDCAQRLQQADVMVLPSVYECGGAVVLEAMAMGMPVIATNWGGPADYLDVSCGILVDPDTRESFIQGLAIAMERLASSPDLRHQMGQAGAARVRKIFDWDAKVDRILEIYDQALKTTLSPECDVTSPAQHAKV
jgi:glycosyltransferase involved in cell wall biosynthesis